MQLSPILMGISITFKKNPDEISKQKSNSLSARTEANNTYTLKFIRSGFVSQNRELIGNNSNPIASLPTGLTNPAKAIPIRL